MVYIYLTVPLSTTLNNL